MSRPTRATYKTRNWPAHDEALERRGLLTIRLDPERHRTCTLLRTDLAAVDQPLPIEVPDPFLARIALERGERGGLGSRRGGLPTSHISIMWKSMRSPKVFRRETHALVGASP